MDIRPVVWAATTPVATAERHNNLARLTHQANEGDRFAMNEQLLLSNIRGVLIRLEETIIFGLIERAQFRVNARTYRRAEFGPAIGDDNLVGFLLHEVECIHAQMRRYTSPDEHPFYHELPEPLLPALRYDENPLQPNRVNINPQLRTCYEQEIVPFLCRPGDDMQYGSTAVCDVACLQALSRRVHYGKFVAESKYQAKPALFAPLIAAGDRPAIDAAITDRQVEQRVLERVALKARTYGQDLDGLSGDSKIDAAAVVEIYARWIIPFTKQVEVDYLLARGPAPERE